ncbi:MAG: MarR family EPS-associated transcriptional regulator [Desulfurivibrionaceae bacterium]
MKETHFEILRLLETEPDISQKELARRLGISAGKTNYCLKALVRKGLVKAENFHKNSNKSKYIYILTPKGIEEKAKVTCRFLRHKMEEYERLKKEIKELKKEVSTNSE